MECIVLLVVKTTLMSFPVEYAISVFHACTYNKFNFHFASTLYSLTYLQEKRSCTRSLLIAARDLAHVLNISPANRLERK